VSDQQQQLCFVAGATGYTGRELVRVLSQEHELATVAHVRPGSSQLPQWRERFAAIGAEVDQTPWQDEAMSATMLRYAPTVVFALLGTTRKRAQRERAAGSDTSYESIDFGLTAMLIRAARQLPEPPRFVYLSSVGAKPSSPGSYMHARWKVEQMLLEGDLPYTIARPSFITGPDRDDKRTGERLGSALVDGALSVAGAFGGRRLRDRYRSTSNTTLARALARLALDPTAENQIIDSEDLRD